MVTLLPRSAVVSARRLIGNGGKVRFRSRITSATSCPAPRLLTLNAGSNGVDVARAIGLLRLRRSVPEKTSVTVPVPFSFGSTQCAAVSTMFGATTVPVQVEPYPLDGL